MDNKIQQLTDVESSILKKLLNYSINSEYSIQSIIHQLEYKEPPVSIDEFVDNNHYIGRAFDKDSGQTFYPKWREAVAEMIVSSIPEVALTGAIGIGKSTAAAVYLSYLSYLLLNRKNLMQVLEKSQISDVNIVFFNLTEDLADSGVFTKFSKMVVNSPWFLDRGTRDIGKKYERALLPAPLKLVISTPKKKGLGIVGQDVIAGVLDEISDVIPAKSKKIDLQTEALEVYTKFSNRIISRYINKEQQLGKLLLISSKQEKDAFLESYIDTKLKKGREILIYDFASYEVLPASTFSGEKFSVAVGDKFERESKIIDENETQVYESDGYNVIQVPVEYKEKYEDDIIRSLRDFSGISIEAERANKLIPNEATLDKCTREYDSICTVEEVRLHPEKKLGYLLDFFDFSKAVDPKASHYMHVDIGLSNDGLGIAMSHAGEGKRLQRIRPDGALYEVTDSTVVLDFALRIVATYGHEVQLPVIQEFIEYLARYFPIKSVTFDQFQSKQMSQGLSLRGISSDRLSMDKDDVPYSFLRQAFIEQRVIMYKHGILRKELLELEHDRMRNKVDHPLRGTKDVADAVGGSAYPILFAKEIGKNAINSDRQSEMMLKMYDNKLNIKDKIERGLFKM